MSTDKIRIAYEFFTDNNMTSYTSQVTSMEASNTMNTQPSVVWRSTSHSVGTIPAQELVYNLGTLRPISFIFAYNNNFSFGCTVQLIIATDAGFTQEILNQTWQGVEPIYGYSEGFYGLVGYGGYDDEGFFYPFFAKYFDMVVGQYVKIIITNADNPDGFIQAGRIACGSYWQPELVNFNWGYTLTKESLSKQTDMRNGGTRTERLGKRRVMNFGFDFLTDVDELEFNRMDEAADKNMNIFVSAIDDNGSTREQLHTMLAFKTDNTSFTNTSVNFRSSTLTLREAK